MDFMGFCDRLIPCIVSHCLPPSHIFRTHLLFESPHFARNGICEEGNHFASNGCIFYQTVSVSYLKINVQTFDIIGEFKLFKSFCGLNV